MKIGLISLFLTVGLLAQPASAAYWLGKIIGDKNGCTITRDGNKIPVAPLMALKTDDKIELDYNIKAILTIDGQADKTISNIHNPFFVPDAPPPPTVIDNLSQMLQTWLQQSIHLKNNLVALVSRGDGDVVVRKGDNTLAFLASADTNYLLDEQRQVTLYWVGGTAPFYGYLRHQYSDKILDQQQSAKNHYLRFNLPTNDPHLTVEIRDSRNKKITLALQRISVQALPHKSQIIRKATLNSAIKSHYLGLSLLHQPRWRLQAVQFLKTRREVLQRVLVNDLPVK